MAKKTLLSSIAEHVEQTELSHGEDVKRDSQPREHTPTIRPSNPTPRYLSYGHETMCSQKSLHWNVYGSSIQVYSGGILGSQKESSVDRAKA